MNNKLKPVILITVIMLFISAMYLYFKQDNIPNDQESLNIGIITKTLDYYDALYSYRIDVVKAIDEKFDDVNWVVNAADEWVVDKVIPTANQQLKLVKELSIGADILIIEPVNKAIKDEILAITNPQDIDVYFIDIDYEAINRQQKQLVNQYRRANQKVIYLNLEDFDTNNRTKIKEQLIASNRLNANDLYVCDNELVTFSLYDALKELKIENNQIIGYGNHPAIKSLIDKQLILASVDFNIPTLINDTINYLSEVAP